MATSTINFFPNQVEIPGRVTVVITKSAYHQIEQRYQGSGASAADILADISRNLSYTLMAKAPAEERSSQTNGYVYYVYQPDGVYLLAEKERETADEPPKFLMVKYSMNNLALQNEAMRYGTMIHFCQGWRIEIRLTDSNLFIDLIDGKPFGSDDPALSDPQVTGTPFTDEMKRKLHMACLDTHKEFILPHFRMEQGDEELIRQGKEMNMPRGLQKLLSMAEDYATLTNDLEEQKARETGSILYSDIRPVAYAERTDRLCYEFVLAEGQGKLNEDVFKPNTMLSFYAKGDGDQATQPAYQAELVELVRQDPDDEESAVVSIKALFTDHIDITDFEKQGKFNVTPSQVNYMVQNAAIQKIGKYETEAADFLSDLYSGDENKVQGIASSHNVDLTDVVDELQRKKYPPNASQMHAITEAIKTDHMYLVMGPPGTGKTTVIEEWVKYFVLKEHKRVLVSSKNNKAVDNVLARLAEQKGINTIRIGSEAKLQENVRKYMFEKKIETIRDEICRNVDEAFAPVKAAYEEWLRCKTALQQYLIMQENIRVIQKEEEQIRALQVKIELSDGNIRDCEDSLTTWQERKQQTEQAKEKKKKSKLPAIFGSRLLMPVYDSSDQKIDQTITNLQNVLEQYKSERDGIQNTILQKQQEMIKKYGASYHDLIRNNPVRSAKEICLRILSENTKAQWVFAPLLNTLQGGADHAQMIKQIDYWNITYGNYQNDIRNWKQKIAQQQNYAFESMILDSVDLVGATCIGIQSKRKFKNIDFDVTIIDEAGQIQVHDALVPISLSPKVIMLGDHKQIPPMADQDLVAACNDNNTDPSFLSKSLFEDMYNRAPDGCKIMLDTQYRMPGDIADTISEWFYDGKYLSPPFKYQIKTKDLMLPSLSDRAYLLIDTSGVPGRHEHAIPGGGCDNRLEAAIIKSLISIRLNERKQISAEDLTPVDDEIGVISAYKAQVKIIRQELTGMLPDNTIRTMAASLDSFQGQERDLIIYSFTKSSDKPANMRRIGFLNELRRLNVAMSRCKKTLVMIGDMQFLGGCKHTDKDEDGNEIYNQSEKQFGDFIRKMCTDVKEKNRGQHFTYQQFLAQCETILPAEKTYLEKIQQKILSPEQVEEKKENKKKEKEAELIQEKPSAKEQKKPLEQKQEQKEKQSAAKKQEEEPKKEENNKQQNAQQKPDYSCHFLYTESGLQALAIKNSQLSDRAMITGFTAEEIECLRVMWFFIKIPLAIKSPLKTDDAWSIVYPKRSQVAAILDVIAALSGVRGAASTQGGPLCRLMAKDQKKVDAFLAAIAHGEKTFIYIIDTMHCQRYAILANDKIIRYMIDGTESSLLPANLKEQGEPYDETVKRIAMSYAQYPLILSEQEAKAYGLSKTTHTISKELMIKIDERHDLACGVRVRQQQTPEETRILKKHVHLSGFWQWSYINYAVTCFHKTQEKVTFETASDYLIKNNGLLIADFEKSRKKRIEEQVQDTAKRQQELQNLEYAIQSLRGETDLHVPVLGVLTEVQALVTGPNARIYQTDYQYKPGKEETDAGNQ